MSSFADEPLDDSWPEPLGGPVEASDLPIDGEVCRAKVRASRVRSAFRRYAREGARLCAAQQSQLSAEDAAQWVAAYAYYLAQAERQAVEELGTPP